MLTIIRHIGTRAGKIGLASSVALGSVLAFASVASATTPDPVSSGFTSLQTQLTGYLGDAVVLVLAIAGISIGIVMLVRWAKRAARA